MAVPQGTDDVILDPPVTLRICWVDACTRTIWPSSRVSRRCGMLDLTCLFPVARQLMQRFWGGVGSSGRSVEGTLMCATISYSMCDEIL
eukprot:365678-Chlamydomonas_euryale.AAC.5